MEINKDNHMRKVKPNSEYALSRESATSLALGRDSKAGRVVGQLYSGKKGRLQACPDWSC